MGSALLAFLLELGDLLLQVNVFLCELVDDLKELCLL